jgi:hypothetical protein
MGVKFGPKIVVRSPNTRNSTWLPTGIGRIPWMVKRRLVMDQLLELVGNHASVVHKLTHLLPLLGDFCQFLFVVDVAFKVTAIGADIVIGW